MLKYQIQNSNSEKLSDQSLEKTTIDFPIIQRHKAHRLINLQIALQNRNITKLN